MASASRGKSTVPKDVIDQFCGITDVSVEVAERLLEACNGNLEMAIGMHMDDGGGGSQAPTAASSTPTSACHSAEHQPAAAVDDVRAPIPQRREVLVQDMNTNFGNIDVYRRRRAPRSVFDGLRDFQAEARQQELAESQASRSQKQKTLEDLFRPPIDIMFKGSFHSARDAGTGGNRWLMVNVQNAKEFQCQMLNRDVWSNAAVKNIIKDNFVFWQVYNDSEEGRKYMQFYKILQWPYIAVLDPRTGENMVTWNNVDGITLCDLVTEFLAEHHLPDGATSPEGPPAKRIRKESIVDATEDSQLQAAIQASMQETKAPAPIVIDSDIEYGSDDELETFTDSEDEESRSTVKTSSKNIDSHSTKSNQSATGKVDAGADSDIQLVSESSSSSLSISSEPSTRKPSKMKTGSESVQPKAGCSSAKSEEPNHIAKQPSHSVTSVTATGGSSSGTISGTSGHSNKDSKDCVNGSNGTNNDNSNSSSSNTATNGTGSEVPQKKFQFVQQSETTHTLSTWQDHLGNTEDAETVINIRFPDGKRQQFKVPCSTKLRALIMFVQEEGYHKEMYELVTNFPKRRLSYLDIEDTLKNHGLFPQETVFVQER